MRIGFIGTGVITRAVVLGIVRSDLGIEGIGSGLAEAGSGESGWGEDVLSARWRTSVRLIRG